LEEVIRCLEAEPGAAIRDATGVDLFRIPVKPEDIACGGGDQL
jgi:hypothetical protein